MIPLRDDIPTHTFPFVNYALIAACVVVFFFQATAQDGGERMIIEYGMIPSRVTGLQAKLPAELQQHPEVQEMLALQAQTPPAVPPWATLFTCMFLHGGLMHILGNMLFLYIFGDNVEDRYGHVGYLLMYVGAGVAAGLLHLWSAPGSMIPTVGASGAIAGVMGAYLVMFRHARVITLIPLGILTQLIAVPAPFFLVLWFLIQLVSATGAAAEGAGVAFWAHVGGFVAGVGATWLLCRLRWIDPCSQGLQHAPAWNRRRMTWN